MLLYHISRIRRSALASLCLILIPLLHLHLLDSLNHARGSRDRGTNRCGAITSTRLASKVRPATTRSWLYAAYPQNSLPGDLRSSRTREALDLLGGTKQVSLHEERPDLIGSLPVSPLHVSSKYIVPPTPHAQAHLKRAPPLASS